jgi:hypothetical protein
MALCIIRFKILNDNLKQQFIPLQEPKEGLLKLIFYGKSPIFFFFLGEKIRIFFTFHLTSLAFYIPPYIAKEIALSAEHYMALHQFHFGYQKRH